MNANILTAGDFTFEVSLASVNKVKQQLQAGNGKRKRFVGSCHGFRWYICGFLFIPIYVAST